MMKKKYGKETISNNTLVSVLILSFIIPLAGFVFAKKYLGENFYKKTQNIAFYFICFSVLNIIINIILFN